MNIIIVCHTESGIVRNKQVIATKDSVGVSTGVRNLAKVANKYGAKVTYAVCPEVAEYFPKNIDCEIGLHIHPGWEEFEKEGIYFMVGDTYLKERCDISASSTVLRDYNILEQLELITTGGDCISEILGAVSYTHLTLPTTPYV